MDVLNEQIVSLIAEQAAQRNRPDVLTGFADASEIIGPKKPGLPYTHVVSIASALNPNAVASVEAGPTQIYYEEVEASRVFVEDLESSVVDYLTRQGCQAMPLTDARHDLINRGMSHEDAAALSHRVVAAHAGLGWIGKNNLVITKHFGPAVTLGGVLTDAPVECGKEVFLPRCGRCVECIVACPAGAINNSEWSGQIGTHDLVNEETCVEECRTQSREKLGFEANVCGYCILACPYTGSYLRRNGLRYS